LLPGGEIRFPSADWPQSPGSPCLFTNDDPLAAGRLPWSNQPYEATFVVHAVDAAGRKVATASKAFWVIGPARDLVHRH
jgi:hypothetical protein